MSVNTYVYTGYFIVAECLTRVEIQDTRVCSFNPNHKIENKDKFCRECGQPIRTRGVEHESLLTYSSGGDELAFNKDITDEEWEWIDNNFDHRETVWINGEDGYDYFTPFSRNWIDADCEGVHEFDPSEIIRPTDEDVERLKQIMKYKSIEIKFGTLVSVS